MFTKTLSPTTQSSLALLGQKKFLSQAYLAGGTTSALWLGHRISYDLDFFTPVKFKVDLMEQKLNLIKNFKKRSSAWGTILGNINDIDFSLFYYNYPLIKKTTKFQGINLASLEDIAAMKIAAVSDRGSKRDFVDIYFIAKKIKLNDILKFYDKKFGNLASNKIHILKSLVYFADAEIDRMPKMIKKANWQEIKTYFTTEIKKIK